MAEFAEKAVLSTTPDAVELLTAEFKSFITKSPFLFIVSGTKQTGVDISPRGDAPGFVKTGRNNKLFLPDRVGNNRVDTLCNILTDPSIALIFLVPGRPEMLTVSGKARILINEQLLSLLASNGKPPKSAIELTATAATMQHSIAIEYSDFWRPKKNDQLAQLASFGEILADQVGGMTKEEATEFVDESYEQRLY